MKQPKALTLLALSALAALLLLASPCAAAAAALDSAADAAPGAPPAAALATKPPATASGIAPTASTEEAGTGNKPVHVSPYALAAKRHALAAANAPLLVIPPSQRRTRLVSGQPQH